MRGRAIDRLVYAGYTVTVKRGGWITVSGFGVVRRFHGWRALTPWVETGTRWTGGFDGAAEPTNPGPAAYGAWLKTPWGDTAWSAGASIGWASNNVAEWRGLIAVLQEARHRGATPLAIVGDSQLVVYQFGGQYATRQPHLQRLRQDARRAASGLDVAVTWVPRAQNAAADALSKAALQTVMPLRFDPERLERCGDHHWIAHGSRNYWVDTQARTCSCPAYHQSRRPCKHLIAALIQG